MTVSKAAILKAQLQGIRATLERTPPKEKGSPAAVHLTESFNGLIAEVAVEYPAIADGLPKPIRSSGPFRRIGKADVSYLDLEIFAEQALNLLALVE